MGIARVHRRGRALLVAGATAALLCAVALLAGTGARAVADEATQLPPIRHVFVINLENFSFADSFAPNPPDRAYLAFDRLEALAVRSGSPERFTRVCKRLIDENPQDWRARLALSRHLAASGRAHDALDLQFAALVQNPHALSIHQAIWRALGQLHHPASLVDRYSELTRHAVFYLDPHVCMRCRYRSTELLWQCPHCHDWNTFVEERIAPAQDATEVEV